jgi:hypothetical protein
MSTYGAFPILTHIDVPGYGGSLIAYLFKIGEGNKTYPQENGVGQ